MAGPMGWLFGIALVTALAAGCGTSAPSRFYTLDSTAAAGGAAGVRAAVLVGPVSVPGSVNRPEFVVRVAPHRVEVDEFHRWAAPLSESIARTVAGDLAAMLGTPDVATAPFANFDPDYRVTINVQRFDSIRGESVLLDAVWSVQAIRRGQTRAGRTVARETVQGDDFDALAAGHSRALAKLSSEIASAIRAELQSP